MRQIVKAGLLCGLRRAEKRLRQASVNKGPDNKLFIKPLTSIGKPVNLTVAYWFSFVLIGHSQFLFLLYNTAPLIQETVGEKPKWPKRESGVICRRPMFDAWQ